jgi:cysteinyl-tRNA synthetase
LDELKIYNTISRKKERFSSIEQGRVTMFVCGPTVQGPMHLGHARTYSFYDMVTRYLSHLGWKVDFLMNITDIDERITTAARESRTDPMILASRFTKSFLLDLKSLGITTVTRFEPVSERIDEAIRQVSALLEGGMAYVADGWVYFDTAKFPRFGQLSQQSKAQLALHPLELSKEKRNPVDFSLWRPEVLIEGKWRSPWGMGSPGWHIQDTAVTLSVFGPQYDIHGGAYELIYPHHEAEIAQGESITGIAPMVKYWVHTHLLTMEGEKMSKSKGNVCTVRDALKKYSADELRFYFLLTHYRTDMDLSGLAVAAKRFNRLKKLLQSSHPSGKSVDYSKFLGPFQEAMNNDFDTPLAVRAIEGLAGRGSREKDTAKATNLLGAASYAMSLLGVVHLGKY